MSKEERLSPRERAAGKMVAVFDSEFLRALTEPARLQLLRVLLVHGPVDVATIASHVPQDRSVVSRHLKVLESAGIVQVRRDGKHRIYAIDGSSFVQQLEEIIGMAKALAPQCCPALPTEPARPTSARRSR
ncbi:MAG TPA: helix-turn-helix domain-containing protein [Polyangiales bacterium]